MPRLIDLGPYSCPLCGDTPDRARTDDLLASPNAAAARLRVGHQWPGIGLFRARALCRPCAEAHDSAAAIGSRSALYAALGARVIDVFGDDVMVAPGPLWRLTFAYAVCAGLDAPDRPFGWLDPSRPLAPPDPVPLPAPLDLAEVPANVHELHPDPIPDDDSARPSWRRWSARRD